MSRPYAPQVVTANRLLEGDAVWLTADDRWSTTIAEAEVLDDEAHAAIRLLDAQAQPDVIVGAYLAEVSPAATGPVPTHFREAFRTRGPSNYAHGKQENL